MDLNFCGKQPRAEHCGCTIDYLSRAGYPILNGSCWHLGSEHPGWFHTQREQSCLGKKLGHKYAYYGVNTSKQRASARGLHAADPADWPGRARVPVPHDRRESASY